MADGSMDVLTGADFVRGQRTAEGRNYDNLRAELRMKMQTDKEFAKRRRESMMRIRAVGPSQVHSDTFMSNLSVQYKNDEFIGEQLMPVVNVSKRSDKFATYSKRERLAFPSDSMAGRSQPNELNETRGSGNYSVDDYGLMNSLSASTEENQDAAFDEMVDLIEAINDGLALNREIRIATILTTAANFGSNTATLSGSDQWDSSAGGNPVKRIQDAVAACWTGAGPGDMVGYCGLDVALVLMRHAQNLDLFKYTMPGLTKMDRLAQELGLSKILVGSARQDTANSGATASYSRIWGKDFGVIRVARRPTLRNASFGYTLRMSGHPITHQWFDPKAGVIGSYFGKVGVSEDHTIVAADTGFLLKAVVS